MGVMINKIFTYRGRGTLCLLGGRDTWGTGEVPGGVEQVGWFWRGGGGGGLIEFRKVDLNFYSQYEWSHSQ